MQIAKVFCPITTLGPGKRICIWVQGCCRSCPNCSNPELQPIDPGMELSLDELFSILEEFKRKNVIDGVTISGGEPFLQYSDLRKVVEYLNANISEDILIYTGYVKTELEELANPDVDYILGNIAVLIDGPYVDELNDSLPLRGSSNQNVIVIRDSYAEIYREYMQGERKVNVIDTGDYLHFIGIPMPGYKEDYQKFTQVRCHE